jgi:hypothetical protein
MYEMIVEYTGISRPMHQSELQLQFEIYFGTTISHAGKFMVKLKVNVSLCFNLAPRHESVLGEWRYSSTHS